MNKRIGLFTEVARKKNSARTTTTSYVDVAGAKDLAQKLAALGAKQVGLLRRDRTGTTHLEGSMFDVAELTEQHLEWATAKPEQFETRGIFYASK